MQIKASVRRHSTPGKVAALKSTKRQKRRGGGLGRAWRAQSPGATPVGVHTGVEGGAAGAGVESEPESDGVSQQSLPWGETHKSRKEGGDRCPCTCAQGSVAHDGPQAGATPVPVIRGWTS